MSLNPLEQEKLQILVGNELLMRAVAKVFNEVVEAHEPKVNDTDSDQLLGEKYRAYTLSRQMVDDFFRQLMIYQRQDNLVKKFNRAK